jgi:3-hydroxyisobutyrate dehydrogenase
MPASDSTLRPLAAIGFIGLGVMGEPMCGHLARRSGLPVMAYDRRPEPLQRLAADGVGGLEPAGIAARCDLILLSLPDGNAVQAVLAEIEPLLRPGQVVVDTSTSPVAMTREVGTRLAAKGIAFADAPIARTREAASRGELSIMVGAEDAVFAHIRAVLDTMGTDVTHCGPIGSGQVVKILNNMLLFQNVCALAEAIAVGRRNGVDPEVLLSTVAKGSGDSFALRNHGMKAMVPNAYPLRAFSTKYAMKDLSYALEMAQAAGLTLKGAELTMQRLQQSDENGHGDEYFPAVRHLIDPS